MQDYREKMQISEGLAPLKLKIKDDTVVDMQCIQGVILFDPEFMGKLAQCVSLLSGKRVLMGSCSTED